MTRQLSDIYIDTESGLRITPLNKKSALEILRKGKGVDLRPALKLLAECHI